MTLLRRPFRRALSAAMLLVLAAVAAAQTPQQQGFTPLDQVIEDQDPLRQSLRRVEQGIGQRGQESYVYTRPGDGRIWYIRPGVVASFDRSQYFQLQDGPLLQMVPPNTIFYLGSPPPSADPASRPRSPLMVERQVDGRISTPTAAAGTNLPRESGLDRYFSWRRLHREALLDAIDRAVASQPPATQPAPLPR